MRIFVVFLINTLNKHFICILLAQIQLNICSKVNEMCLEFDTEQYRFKHKTSNSP